MTTTIENNNDVQALQPIERGIVINILLLVVIATKILVIMITRTGTRMVAGMMTIVMIAARITTIHQENCWHSHCR